MCMHMYHIMFAWYIITEYVYTTFVQFGITYAPACFHGEIGNSKRCSDSLNVFGYCSWQIDLKYVHQFSNRF